MNKKLAIIGSGDLGQLISWHAKSLGFEVIGFFDDFKPEGTVIHGVPVIGPLSKIEDEFKNGLFDEVIVGIGYHHMEFRSGIYARLSHTIPFANVIHKSVVMESSVKMGSGNFILPGTVLDHNVEMGNNIVLNVSCTVAHDTSIGDHTFLGPSVSLAGFVKIGQKCFLGINTSIIDNISVCNNTQTGGATVVIENIKTEGLYVGAPARRIK